jgi:hypothetical protein
MTTSLARSAGRATQGAPSSAIVASWNCSSAGLAGAVSAGRTRRDPSVSGLADLEVAHLPKRPDLLRLGQRVPVRLRLALSLGTTRRPLRWKRRQSTRYEWCTFRHFGLSKMAWLSHAPGTIRTCDLCLRRAALYPLSYGRESRQSTSGLPGGLSGRRCVRGRAGRSRPLPRPLPRPGTRRPTRRARGRPPGRRPTARGGRSRR